MRVRLLIYHMYNDYSGSPKILSFIIKELTKQGYRIDLFTSTARKGFLSGLERVNYHNINYFQSKFKILMAIQFVIIQTRYFFSVFFYSGRSSIIYLNTILPFGAALAAKILGRKRLYYIHEYPFKRNIVYRLAIKIFYKCADNAVFVSNHLSSTYNIPSDKKIVIENALDPEFKRTASLHSPIYMEKGTVLMAGSLKIYKGVNVFVELSKLMPDFSFILILNANTNEIDDFKKRINAGQNIQIVKGTGDLNHYYSKAHLVVNLSDSKLWIESFGLTVLEAMSYGLPVIVPSVGGITELVEDGINGYKADTGDTDQLRRLILLVFADKEKYIRMSENARKKAGIYSYETLTTKVTEILERIASA